MNASDPVQLALIAVGLAIVTGFISIGTLLINNHNIRVMKRDDAEAVKQEKIRVEAREDALADKLSAQTEAARQAALHARGVMEEVAKKVDGLLADRDKANYKAGADIATLAGEDRAKTLAEGQQQGRDTERERVRTEVPVLPASPAAPIPVLDEKLVSVIQDVLSVAEDKEKKNDA